MSVELVDPAAYMAVEVAETLIRKVGSTIPYAHILHNHPDFIFLLEIWA